MAEEENKSQDEAQNEAPKDQDQESEDTSPETVKVVLEAGTDVVINGHSFKLVYDTVCETTPSECEGEKDAEEETPAEPAAPAEPVAPGPGVAATPEKPAEQAPAQ